MDGPFIQELLDKGYSYTEIASELQRRNVGNTRGLSERSVRRFVKGNQMRAKSKSQQRRSTDDCYRRSEFLAL